MSAGAFAVRLAATSVSKDEHGNEDTERLEVFGGGKAGKRRSRVPGEEFDGPQPVDAGRGGRLCRVGRGTSGPLRRTPTQGAGQSARGPGGTSSIEFPPSTQRVTRPAHPGSPSAWAGPWRCNLSVRDIQSCRRPRCPRRGRDGRRRPRGLPLVLARGDDKLRPYRPIRERGSPPNCVRRGGAARSCSWAWSGCTGRVEPIDGISRGAGRGGRGPRWRGGGRRRRGDRCACPAGRSRRGRRAGCRRGRRQAHRRSGERS